MELNKSVNSKTSVLEYLNTATRVYGCFNYLTDKRVIDKLTKIPCCIIVQNEDWTTTPWKELAEEYKKLTPIAFSYFNRFDPNLSCVIKDYKDKAVRSVGYPADGNQLMSRFLIIEQKNIVGLWDGNSRGEIYTDDMDIVLEFRKEFFNFLCLSGEVADSWQPYQYYEMRDTDWTLLENKPKFLTPSDSISLSALPGASEPQNQSYYHFLGKLIYNGIKIATEIKFGCARCGRNSHISLNCYAKRDLYGRWLNK